MSIEDLANIRLARPRMCELPVSVQAVQQISHPYQRLWRSGPAVFPRRARRLLELVPAYGDVPLFLAPEMVDDIDEAIDIVQTTPAARIRTEMSAVPASTRRRQSSWVDDLCRGRVETLRELGTAMRAYHDQVMAPLSLVHSRGVATELSRRSHQLATEGIAAMLNDLHPSIRWRSGLLEVAAGPVCGDVDLSGRGLRVMPSVWPRPGVALGWSQPTLVYPIPRAIWLVATDTAYDGAAAALGVMRAAVLQALVEAHTTTTLASAVSISLSSASAHAAALRRAGLVASQRDGQAMVHYLTPLGLDVLTASKQPDRSRLPTTNHQR